MPSWSVEAIIAFVTLLATCVSIGLLLWHATRNRRGIGVLTLLPLLAILCLYNLFPLSPTLLFRFCYRYTLALLRANRIDGRVASTSPLPLHVCSSFTLFLIFELLVADVYDTGIHFRLDMLSNRILNAAEDLIVRKQSDVETTNDDG
jgi:hypothetical protein